MTKHNWDNDTDKFKYLGSHNSLYSINDIDWSKYYIYPRSKYNVRPDCFEFYCDSSSEAIVPNYEDDKNALTYPLEFNITQRKFPDGWGVQAFNEAKKIEELKYNIGNDIYCPVVLEPGTVVYEADRLSDFDEGINTDIASEKTARYETGYRECFLFLSDTRIRLDAHKYISSTEYEWVNLFEYYARDFSEGVLPRRILIRLQGAGGGGSGAEDVTGGTAGGGGGGGGFVAFVLDLDKIRCNNGEKYYKIELGKGGSGGTRGKHGGSNGGDSKLYYAQQNATRPSKWDETLVITARGGSGGYYNGSAHGGDYKAEDGAEEWISVVGAATGGSGHKEWEEGGSCECEYSTFINEHVNIGSHVKNKQDGGQSGAKSGGGGASFYLHGAGSLQNGAWGAGGSGGRYDWGAWNGTGYTGGDGIFSMALLLKDKHHDIW